MWAVSLSDGWSAIVATGAGSTIAPREAFVIRDLDKNNILEDFLTQKINKMSVIWRQIAPKIIDFDQN